MRVCVRVRRMPTVWTRLAVKGESKGLCKAVLRVTLSLPFLSSPLPGRDTATWRPSCQDELPPAGGRWLPPRHGEVWQSPLAADRPEGAWRSQEPLTLHTHGHQLVPGATWLHVEPAAPRSRAAGAVLLRGLMGLSVPFQRQ